MKLIKRIGYVFTFVGIVLGIVFYSIPMSAKIFSIENKSEQAVVHTTQFEKLRHKAGNIEGTTKIKKVEKFKEAVNKHIAAYPQEEGIASLILGEVLKNVDYTIRDYELSLRMYRKAYELIPEADTKWKGMAIYNIGQAYYLGIGVDQDFQKAYDCFLKASEINERYCNMLGEYYCFGILGERNFPLALSYYKKAAFDGNDATSFICISMVEYLLKHIEEGTFNELAFEEFKKGVLAISQSDSSDRYLVSAKHMKAAADMGFAPAELDYASYFLTGDIINDDLQVRDNIEQYFKDAISQNYAPAIHQYGVWLQYKKTIPMNLYIWTYEAVEEAFPYFKEAADLNFANSLVAVGNYYFRGLAPITRPDFTKAYDYYAIAAALGSIEGEEGKKQAAQLIGTTALPEREAKLQQWKDDNQPLLMTLLQSIVEIKQSKEKAKDFRNGTYNSLNNSQNNSNISNYNYNTSSQQNTINGYTNAGTVTAFIITSAYGNATGNSRTVNLKAQNGTYYIHVGAQYYPVQRNTLTEYKGYKVSNYSCVAKAGTTWYFFSFSM